MSRKLTVGELFAGIGGFGLGLERTGGFEVKWQVENDNYCNRVLAKHWPDVRRYEDVREVGRHNLEPVDLVCGGFPCQPFSTAGVKQGKEDDRWLWPEMARVISDIRPTWVIAENVAGIIRMELDSVLSDLENLGYSAETYCMGAVSIDAPHRRMRVFIVGNANGQPKPLLHDGRGTEGSGETAPAGAVDDCHASSNADVAHAHGQRGRLWEPDRENATHVGEPPGGEGSGRGSIKPGLGGGLLDGVSVWMDEPDIPRTSIGVKDREARLRCIGNAVVPQIVTILGNAILRVEGML